MIKYMNSIGEIVLVVEADDTSYIIFDNQEDEPQCTLFDEHILQKYIDNGFKLCEDSNEKMRVGDCTCGCKIFENNRIKVRDYFECPKCNKISSRNDLIN